MLAVQRAARPHGPGDEPMSEAKGNQEPSMEEILASIRRIISEEEGGQPKPTAKAPEPVKKEEPEDELLLTETVDEPAPPPPPPPPPKPAAEPMQAADIDAMFDNPPAPEPAKPAAPPQETEAEPMPSSTTDRDEDLVSPEVASASAAAMAQLVGRRAHTAVELATPGQGLLVETLVRQAVEPLLRDWLDNNLQAIVERLVRREVERIARRAELG